MINAQEIYDVLHQTQNVKCDAKQITAILAKARLCQGLEAQEVATLTMLEDPELLQQLFATAKQIKEKIYGNRLVLFAPLYISNLCTNECLYCAFRATNKKLQRRSLSQQEIQQETSNLIAQGQKRVLLVAGESYTRDGFQYILDAIQTIYAIKNEYGEIRRINVNIAPLTLDDFKRLKAAAIGTYQLFQETYHPETYRKMHVAGKKADYNWRISAIDRAMQAGIDDVGIGVLFGLADWKFELLALLQHSRYLEQTFGVGPHTISVPRLEPASGSQISQNPPHPVSDFDFCKIVAILRLAVPFTGIIMSTRETAKLRRETLELGVSQISAGSKTNPGGYSKDAKNASQFSLGDHRSIDEVVHDVANLGYIPSFCTACYRLGRTGKHFMDLAKSSTIKNMCIPNALLTFQEYLQNYASKSTYQVGNKLIAQELAKLSTNIQQKIAKQLTRIKDGEHDIFI